MIPIRSLFVLVVLALLPACSNRTNTNEDDEQGNRASPGRTPAKAPATAANFQVTTTPQGPFKVGGEGRVDVRLTPRNGYHVNQEYPIELRLDPAEGVKLAKTKLVRTDASTFEEAQAVLPITFTPESAGRKALHGTLKFSVCNPQNCQLERQAVSAEFEAQP